MEISYFDFLKAKKLSDYKKFILSGDEPLQKHNIIEKINGTFKKLGYEILRYDISDSSYDALYSSTDNLSLFNEQKFIQLNLEKPPQKKLQSALIENICKDSGNVYLLIFNNLKKQSISTKWFQTLSLHALHTHIYTPNINTAIKILKEEVAKEDDLQLSEEALHILAQKTEANLIASKQIIKLLGRQETKTFDSSNIKPFLHSHSNYDVFDLSDAIIEQNKIRAFTILNQLTLEGDKLPLILWTLKREIRIIYQLQTTNPSYHQKIYQENNIWKSKQKYYPSLANKVSKNDITKSLEQCLEIDLCIKGLKTDKPNNLFNEIIFRLIK